MDKELKELMDKLLDKMGETNKRDISKVINDVKEALNEDNTECLVFATNERIIYGGTILDELALLSSIVNKLHEKVPTEILAMSVFAGFGEGTSAKLDLDTINKLLETLKQMMD